MPLPPAADQARRLIDLGIADVAQRHGGEQGSHGEPGEHAIGGRRTQVDHAIALAAAHPFDREALAESRDDAIEDPHRGGVLLFKPDPAGPVKVMWVGGLVS